MYLIRVLSVDLFILIEEKTRSLSNAIWKDLDEVQGSLWNTGYFSANNRFMTFTKVLTVV